MNRKSKARTGVRAAGLLALLAAMSLTVNAAVAATPGWTWMYQCEQCSNEQQAAAFASAAQQSGAAVYVFSVANERIFKFEVYFDREMQQWAADGLPVDDVMASAFQGMLRVKQINSIYYTQSEHTVRIDLRDVSFMNGNDLVRMSIGGEGSPEFSQFMTDFNRFLSCSGCVERASPLLAQLLEVAFDLDQLGINFFAGGNVGAAGTITWQAKSNIVKVKVCNASGDCAVLKISHNGDKVDYLGTWDASGRRYPSPDQTSSSQNFGATQDIDARTYSDRLRGAGVDIIGSFSAKTHWLVCAYSGGALISCYWQ